MLHRSFRLEQLALRLLLWTFPILAFAFAVQFIIDVWLTGAPLDALMVTPGLNTQLASTVSRAFNNLTAMVLAFIALAIPITANMYTPRLIEIFVRDRVNLLVLCFFALSGANAIFVQAMGFPGWAPSFMYGVIWVGGVVGFAILLPYYFYVLSFLDPDRIIERVTGRIVEQFERIGHDDEDPQDSQICLNERILHLGNVILRAVERADRDVALGAVKGLRRALREYVSHKARAQDRWFDVCPDVYMGLSEDALAVNLEERVWVERRCLGQLQLAFSAALTRMRDAISAISDVNRQVALSAQEDGDRALVRLCVRFFNTFLRLALRQRDTHAVYDVFFQYRRLAEGLSPASAEIAREVAGYWRHYADFARELGMGFVYELAAYETAVLLRTQYREGSVAAGSTLDAFLAYETAGGTSRMLVSRAVVGGYFAQTEGLEAEGARVAACLAQEPIDALRAARQAVEQTVDPVYWEVTDRQLNVDYVPPERRPAVLAVLDAAIKESASAE